MIRAKLFLQLLVVLFDLPPALGDALMPIDSPPPDR
jgi:hypothetical protein